MPTYCFTIDLHLAAPVLSRLSGARAFGLDTAALRAPQQPALPGSLVRGNLRQSWDEFVALLQDDAVLSQADVDTWLGVASTQANQPHRARLNFGHAWVARASEAPDGHEPAKKDNAKVRHRIQIDPQTGTVAQGALQVIEQPHAPGETVVFQGRVHGQFATAEEAARVANWLYKGLAFVPALACSRAADLGGWNRSR